MAVQHFAAGNTYSPPDANDYPDPSCFVSDYHFGSEVPVDRYEGSCEFEDLAHHDDGAGALARAAGITSNAFTSSARTAPATQVSPKCCYTGDPAGPGLG